MHYLLNDFKYYIAVLLCCIVAFRCFFGFLFSAFLLFTSCCCFIRFMGVFCTKRIFALTSHCELD